MNIDEKISTPPAESKKFRWKYVWMGGLLGIVAGTIWFIFGKNDNCFEMVCFVEFFAIFPLCIIGFVIGLALGFILEIYLQFRTGGFKRLKDILSEKD